MRDLNSLDGFKASHPEQHTHSEGRRRVTQFYRGSDLEIMFLLNLLIDLENAHLLYNLK